MSVGLVVLNAAYFVYTASAAFKEILYLRISLLVATFLYMVYGIVEPNWTVLLWNIPVAILHLWAVWQLQSARRRIDLDDEADAIHTLLFTDLDRVAFNILWHCGEERTITDDILITKGEPVDELTLILDGEVNVEVRADLTVRLSQYRFVGELSSLTDDVGNATVTALGDLRARVWQKEELAACGQKHPEIQVALLRAMGLEAARKVT